ncbi:hypothetical protein PsYK624_172760 [Phanerochaete sordida]|uniref:DUF659 domain-containing protein n=1 Tax=Phanerochaete sordida TaxID=48140 RepID=A0A9P3GT92_9APHY|nr:hypothetical protein PsYK624_172760 [Phanerochaete sordida]
MPQPINTAHLGSHFTAPSVYDLRRSVSSGYSTPGSMEAIPSPLAGVPGLQELPYSTASLVPTPEPLAGQKRLRHSHSQYSLAPTAEPFTPQRQQLLEDMVSRITASVGISHSWVEDPEWRKFLAEFIPGARPFSRKTLTKRLIPRSLTYYKAKARSKIQNKVITLHTDGWSGINFHHFQSFSGTADRNSHPLKLTDTSAERKTAELLLVHIRKMITELRDNSATGWRARLAAFVTDNSGESLSARNTIAEEYPDILCFPCYAHQINLIVGDYLNKCGAEFLVQAKKADEIITWLRSKTFVLALLRDIQVRARGKSLAIIRAVITRWIAHYLAYRRLLEVRTDLQALVAEDQARITSQLVTGNRAAKTKAEEVIGIIRSDEFWHSLARAKSHLGPLAQAANILQASYTRLDHVPLVFGMLYHHFHALRSLPTAHPDDILAANTIVASAEKRWMAADQDVFIAAIILHPGLKLRPLNATDGPFSFIDITRLMQRIYSRLFPSTTLPASALEQNLRAYLNDTGQFSGMSGIWQARQAATEHDEAGMTAGNGDRNDPLQIWQDIRRGLQLTPLEQIADLLLPICPNNGGVERFFSLLKRLLTAGRSRLTTENLMNEAELSTFIRSEQEASGTRLDRAKRRRRHYVDVSSVAASSHPPSSTPASTAPPTPETPIAAPLPDADSSIPTQSTDSADDETTAALPLVDSLGTIAARLIADSEENARTPDPGPRIHTAPGQGDPYKLPLSTLFDYRNIFWIQMVEKWGIRSLEGELAAYSIIDDHAEAEDDPDTYLV